MNPKAPHTQALSNYVNGFVLETSFNWGFWDILAWNDIKTIDGIQSLIFDESTTTISPDNIQTVIVNTYTYGPSGFKGKTDSSSTQNVDIGYIHI